MATVTFADILLYPVGDAESQVVLPATEISETDSVIGGVRQYAGGVRRSITAQGKRPDIRATLRYPSRQIVERIEPWLGRVCVWRDHNSRVIWALLARIQKSESPRSPTDRIARVTLTLQPTTDSAEI